MPSRACFRSRTPGLVYHVPDSAYTFGVGMNSVAGFKTSLPSDPTNPILAPAAFRVGPGEFGGLVFPNHAGAVRRAHR